uniref:Uncharacterized protein n=1 Tax=Aegilops tauschii subsp. strangulata TaxID=200361 RepID=A0A453A428_AEGTS
FQRCKHTLCISFVPPTLIFSLMTIRNFVDASVLRTLSWLFDISTRINNCLIPSSSDNEKTS